MDKKIILNEKMYTLITKEEYMNNKAYYDNESGIAVDLGDNYALPVVQNRNAVGLYTNGMLTRCTMPSEEDKHKYMITEDNQIDFNSVSNISDYYEKCIKYNDAEREIITTVKNEFKPKVKEEDSPLLKLVKETVCDKNIDIDKYADRFDNYNNNKRLLSPGYNDITINKATLLLSNLDVDMYCISMNKDSDVPNPMEKPMIRKLTGDGEEIEIEDFINILKGE